MKTVSIKKRNYLRSINKAIPMDKDFYAPTTREEAHRRIEEAERDVFSEMDLPDEELEARLEAFFAEQRECCGSTPIPEECIPMEEAYRTSIKHLEELYAKKKSLDNA